MADSDDPYIRDESARTGQDAWRKINAAAAIALVVYLGFWRDAFYPWLARQDYLFTAALVGLVGAVPLVAYVKKMGRPILAVWIIALTVLIALAAGRASGDAQVQNYYNCWTLSSSERDGVTREKVACAPGSEPKQGSYFSRWSESGSSRFCDLEDDLAENGVTVWNCEQEVL